MGAPGCCRFDLYLGSTVFLYFALSAANCLRGTSQMLFVDNAISRQGEKTIRRRFGQEPVPSRS